MAFGVHEASGLIRGESPVLPWFLPGVAISVVVSLAAGGVVGRVLGTRRAVASLLVLGLGIIVSATLTPLDGVLDLDTLGRGTCDFSRMWLPALGELRRLNDTSLNVLLFIPLGISIALLPRSRRTLPVVVAAFALPFAVELVQLLVPALARGCQSADVVDNLLGLTVGVAVGVAARGLVAVTGRAMDRGGSRR
jgi:hypothetical protein